MMRKSWLALAALALVAASAQAVDFERYLKPEDPTDRAILNFVALDKEGKASSNDLADLGVLLVQRGYVDEAKGYLKRSLKLKPDNYQAAFRLGLLYQRQGHDRKAIHYYKRAAKSPPAYGPAYFMMAMAEERLGRRDAAISDYARAYRSAPELSRPASNPLVLNSRLQTEALLRFYPIQVRWDSFVLTPIDPELVQEMTKQMPQAPKPPQQGGEEH